MNKKYYGLVTLILMLPLLLMTPVSAYTGRYGIPRIDEIKAEVETDPAIATSKFLSGIFDFMPDIIRAEDRLAVEAAGHATQSMGGFHVCYLGVNTRDYIPDDFGQPDAGLSLYPLNLTAFRKGLAWSALSIAQKEAAIADIYGAGIVVPAFTIVPEALGIWHNDALTPPGGDYAKAWGILAAAGFDNTTTPGTLLAPNGQPVRDFEVESPDSAPTSVQLCQRFVDQWNEFFDDYVGVTNCNFVNVPEPFGSVEILNAFYYRNFDMYWLCWGLTRFPDFIYDFFHSSQDYPGAFGNSPGIANATLDAYIEVVKWGTDLEAKYQACWDAQEVLLEQHPYIYQYHRNYWTAIRSHTPDALVNYINVGGTGTDNGWTWSLMHWASSPTGGLVKYNWGEYPETLHPGFIGSAYEQWLVGLITDGLISVTPDLVDIPWIALDWETEPFVWTPLGITDGQKVTYRVRDDLYWNDGFPITAEDMKFSLEFADTFARYGATMQYFLWVEIEDPHTIAVYTDNPSQFIYSDFAGLCLLFPQHIYDPDMHPTRDTSLDPVWEIDWDDWMADYTGTIPGTAGFAYTALVGNGIFDFVEYFPTLEIANLTRNTRPGDFFSDTPIEGAIDVPGRVDVGTLFEYNVVITNAGSKDNVTGELAPCEIASYTVYIDGVPVTVGTPGELIQPFRAATYGPHTATLAPGTYNFTVVVREEGVADPIDVTSTWVICTLPEDLNYDIYVGIDDIVRCAEAFGSAPPPFPGSERWDSRGDLNNDWYVGIDDIVDIAEDFGGP
jgi:ABC-type transport system substrate-binding protein